MTEIESASRPTSRIAPPLVRRALPFLLVILLPASLACQGGRAEPHLRFRERALRLSDSIFDLYFTSADRQAARDVARELSGHLDRLSRDLQCEYAHRTAVEIYPDQAAYDANLMDQSVKGTPACSGRHTIQMVSPRSPIRIAGVSYAGRLGMAVHELAHLFVNEINPKAPLWLQEGAASYEGGADWYRNICRIPAVSKALKSPPSLRELGSSYHGLPGADVFAFTIVDYVFSSRGTAALNDLLRRPSEVERVMGCTRQDFEAQWHEFIRTRY